MKKGLSGWGKKHSFAFKYAVLSTFYNILIINKKNQIYKYETTLYTFFPSLFRIVCVRV